MLGLPVFWGGGSDEMLGWRLMPRFAIVLITYLSNLQNSRALSVPRLSTVSKQQSQDIANRSQTCEEASSQDA